MAVVSHVADCGTQTTIHSTCDAATQTDPVITVSTQIAVSNTSSLQPNATEPQSQATLSSSQQSLTGHPSDVTYEPSDSQATTSQSQSSLSVTSVVDDRKFLIFESQLDKLLFRLACPNCQCPCSIDDVIKKCSNEGTLLRVKVYCTSGHCIIDWQSQPLIGKMPAGNLLLSAAILFSGQTFRHIESLAEMLNLNLMSRTPFYNIQRDNLVPVIMASWQAHQQTVFNELRRQDTPLRLCGDGRMDSPGFCAKYCLRPDWI